MEGTTISFASAACRVAAAAVIWCVALAIAAPTSKRQLSRGAWVVVALFVAGAVLGQPLWVTYDSTVDLAIGRLCAAGHCPTLGVYASEGSFEGGALWDWILGLLFALDESPGWLRWSFLAAHAFGAGVVAALPANARVGVASGALFFALSYGLAPGYIAWHPTLAPVAMLPAVLLAIQSAASPDRERLDLVRAGLLGASFGVGLGVYIAGLFLGPLLIMGLLRGRVRELVAVAAGLCAEQVIVTPEAAWNNLSALGLDAYVVGFVVLALLLFARRWTPSWAVARPAALAFGLAVATIVAGALVAAHGVYPFYVALLAPLVALAFAEIGGSSRALWTMRSALVAITVSTVVTSSWFYRTATADYHDGFDLYRDLHALGGHFHGGYGVAVSSSSYALYFSFPLWASDEPALPHRSDRGIAIWRAGERSPGICEEGTEQTSGDLHVCEYAPFARTEGARACVGGIERADHAACRSFDVAAAFELPIRESPIHYPRREEPRLHASFSVPVCVDGATQRVLEPVVFPRLAVRPRMTVREPAWGRLTDDGRAVLVTAETPVCGTLEWEWNGDAVPLVAWERDTVPTEAFEGLVFFVRERAP